VFFKIHVQLYFSFRDELPEIDTRLQQRLVQDNLRRQREVPHYQADSAGVARSETIVSSVYLWPDRGSSEGFQNRADVYMYNIKRSVVQ